MQRILRQDFNAATITISNIPQEYTDLYVWIESSGFSGSNFFYELSDTQSANWKTFYVQLFFSNVIWGDFQENNVFQFGDNRKNAAEMYIGAYSKTGNHKPINILTSDATSAHSASLQSMETTNALTSFDIIQVDGTARPMTVEVWGI